MMRITLIVFSCLALGLSCTAQKPAGNTAMKLDDHHVLLLQDSTAAAYTLLQDPMDRFFERVTASEMSIQMKKGLAEGQTRGALLPAFRDYLRRDVENFTPEQITAVGDVFREVFNTCNAVAPDIFPDTLILIKTKAKHYGEAVYYTRTNCIIIPYDVMQPMNREEFTATMYHELFHVYSRLNAEKRVRLYRLIGFEHVGVDHLQLPEALAARVLFNPDGVDFGQKITLATAGGKTLDVIPVIYANHAGFEATKQDFFGYVEFNLYPIEKSTGDSWKVLTKPDGFSSPLNMNELPDFFRQIKDNTRYIIHPDEILADNFSFIMQNKTNPKITARFSADGKKLLADMEEILVK